MVKSEVGLGNESTLTKIDKLRELNVGAMIPLPQLVAVGDQSSGKISVLESVTGFSFPRAAGLCTRYATQITCRRAAKRRIFISIIPRPNADEQTKKRIPDFKHELPKMDDEELINIFEEANVAMDIRISKTSTNDGRSAFSQDILKIEICGPDQDHLTVINVPGIFRVATPGLTSESDIVLVENMVKSYMNDRRTIILAIVPCNVDLATQEILKLAETADPSGVRTMGVLTRPDLATEEASKDTIRDLVIGKGSNLKLGYHIVKNRGADDHHSTLSERFTAEEAFFMDSAWSSITDHCDITSLKLRLPDVEQRLHACKAKLEAMGPARASEQSQRLYLAKLASRFQEVTGAALNGYYASDKLFKTDPGLKLVTKMMKLNEDFSNTFKDRGHKLGFGPEWTNDEKEKDSVGSKVAIRLPFEIPTANYPELLDILQENDYDCPSSSENPIMEQIKDVYASSRGPELGTAVFEEQSEKWEPLVLSHTSKAIVLVHDYIFELLTKLCPEAQVREQLWDVLLIDRLCDAYRRAMAQAQFLLQIECGGRPTTFNHYFNATLQRKRAGRMVDALEDLTIELQGHEGEAYVNIKDIKDHAKNKDNTQQVCEDILDALTSTYKVSRKRFVDVICQQVILYFLLEGEESPLKVMGSDTVMRLTEDQLELIAGEDVESKQQRMTLERQKKSLEAALKVLWV
ncbi:interferon-induced GTP-binding protein Mx2 [Apiospora marii]|uniref:interferon-induced GTP-binding protein Mx2 n=1 Tax=Apiospora marii TaxID=335849 RepID=UPI00312CE4F7